MLSEEIDKIGSLDQSSVESTLTWNDLRQIVHSNVSTKPSRRRSQHGPISSSARSPHLRVTQILHLLPRNEHNFSRCAKHRLTSNLLVILQVDESPSDRPRLMTSHGAATIKNSASPSMLNLIRCPSLCWTTFEHVSFGQIDSMIMPQCFQVTTSGTPTQG